MTTAFFPDVCRRFPIPGANQAAIPAPRRQAWQASAPRFDSTQCLTRYRADFQMHIIELLKRVNYLEQI
jgi:hypothetical protein